MRAGSMLGGLLVGVGALFSLSFSSVRAADFTLYDMPAVNGPWRQGSGVLLAQGFSTHSTGAYLKSVTVRIRNANEANSSSNPSSKFSVSLWSGQSGAPLAKIADLATDIGIGQWGDGDFTYQPASEVTLGTAAAEYFVAVTGTGTASWKCDSTNPTADQPPAGYTRKISSDGGSTWSDLTSGACSGKYFRMVVIATDVSSVTTTSTSSTTTTEPATTTTTSTTTSTPTTTSTSTTSTSTTTTEPRPPAVVAPRPTTTTEPATTTTTEPPPAATTSITPAPEPVDDDPTGFFGGPERASLALVATEGNPVSQVKVQVSAENLVPGSEVVVRVFSDPIEIFRGAADAGGRLETETGLPSEIGAGVHTVVLDATGPSGPKREMGFVTIDDDLNVLSTVTPSVVTPSLEPGSSLASRAARTGHAIYDASAQPAATSALAVATAAIASLVASGVGGAGVGGAGAAGGSSGSSERRRDAKGKLASFVSKKLKPMPAPGDAWGDRSRTWRWPWTSRTDAFSRDLPGRVGGVSATLPRIAIDGAWLRACLGSAAYLPWAIAFVAGVANGVSNEGALAPSAAAATVFAALGFLDAGIGFAAWAGTVLGALVDGSVASWHDVRTMLGLAVLYTGLSPLAHVIRPLRRQVADRMDAIERALDYVIMPVFLAFAGASMLKALNGLSALDLVAGPDVSRARWLFAGLAMVRLGLEDVVRAWYPERMASVQPAKLRSPSKRVSVLGVVPRSVLVIFVAAPFFGLTWQTCATALLLAIPLVLKPWEDDMPNVPAIHKWLPRGLFRFLCLLVLGLWLSSVLVPGGDAEALRRSAVWLLVPSTVVGIVELFGRQGGDWNDVRVKWGGGALVWTAAAGIVTGMITLF